MRLLVVFLLFVTSLESYGDECPLKSTTLATDADLATFKASVISCDTVDGDLTLKGEALVDVQGLEGLREITGALKLHATNLYSIEGLSGLTSIGGTLSIGARGIGGTALQNLDPLSNLEVVGSVALFGNRQLIQINALSGITQTQDVWLYSNSALRDLEGLSGLTKIGGNLAIGSSSTLTSLDGLANVTEVNGAFTLEYSPLITNLDGLASLTSLGAGILIKENQTLRSIDGLQKLTTVPNSIVLFGLPALESFDGFSALTSVGGTFRMEFVGSVPNLQPLAQLSSVASIFLKNNDNLESVSALQNITSLDGFLRIDRNPKLTSLEGLENVASVSGNLDVNTNGNLSDCSSIATLLRSDGGILGAVSIYENKQGCNSVEEIIGTALICADAEGDCADSDLDGLTDYQERLLGTNPNFFDTDFDSISDGEEVEVGRDPLAPDYLIASGADVCIQDDQSIHCGYRTSVSFKGLADVFPAKKIDMTHMYGRTCVLSRAGEIACWGKDGGDPTFIGGGVYRELAAGERHTCGVNVAGEVECFGDNSFGQSTVPDLDDPVQITAGLRFTCAIDENQVKCWGASDQQANAPPATLNPRQLSSSSFHSCVLDDTGVQCWGANDYGQSNVPDLLNPRFIDAGRYETCALDDSGIVCWGRIAAKSRVYETGQVHRIAAEDSIAALTSDGFVFTTDLNPGNDVVISNLVFRDFDADGLADLKDPDDDNDSILDPDDPFPLNPALGQDSDGDGVDDSLDAFPNDPSESGDADGDGVGDNRDAFPNDPLEILDSDGDGVGDNGDAFPNNPNESSDLDKDGIGDNADPDDDGDGLSDVEEGALGSNPLSADTDVDGLRDNEEVERGTAVLYFDTDFDGISDGEEVEVGRNPLVADYLVSAGGGEACVQDDQGVSCGYFRRISYPGLSELFPLRDMGTAEYKGRMCAVSREGGEVRCWAKEGPGAATTSPFATFKPFDSGGFKEIAVGAAHVCGIKTDNTVICDGGATNDPPVMQSPKSITAGSEFTCAIDQGQVICWGVEEVAGAVPEGIVDAKQVSAALYHACALDANGVKCWGGNGYGQSDVPTDLQNPRYLDVGRYESCVLDDSGVRCWGRLSYLSRDFEAGTIHQLSRERTTVALKSTGFAIWEDGTQSNDQLIPEVIWSEGFESPVLNATNFPLYNGDWVNFGTPTPNFDTGSDAPVDTSFTGDSGSVWTVSLGNIDIANSSLFDAAEGSQSLNLNGHEQGAVQVTIDFPANGTYELEFALSKNPENVDTAEVAISLDGESVLGSPLSFSESVTREEMNYKLVRVRLQVDQSGDHVLELKSLNTGSPNGYGPVVDDLKIRQVIIFNDFDADGIKDLDDLDDDNDGISDLEEKMLGTSPVNTDSDRDGFTDSEDAFPLNSAEWLDTDDDGTGNNEDQDDDNDTYLDDEDVFPLDGTEWLDTDKDGIGDNQDSDKDGDGVANADDPAPLDPNVPDITGQAPLIFVERFESPLLSGAVNFGDKALYGIVPPVVFASLSGRLQQSFVGDSGIQWTVTNGNVEILAMEGSASSAGQVLDLNGQESGTIEGRLDLRAKGLYELTLSLQSQTSNVVNKVGVNLDGKPIQGSPLTLPESAGSESFNEMSLVFLVPGPGVHYLSIASLTQGVKGPLLKEIMLKRMEPCAGSTGDCADSDGDGLKDGLEQQIGTDASFVDTDFDGISDGEEVEVGRNPLVADYLVSAGGGEACVQDDQGVSCGYFRRISYPGLSELFPLRDMGTAEYKGRMCAVSREGGEVRCWAKEGPGAATTSPFATFKPFDSGGFKEIAVGAAHVCGIKTDNTVICDGGATNDPPVMQSPKSITAGSEFTCAIDQGQVICWGVEEVAGAVPEGIVDAKQVSAALYHACALDANGVKCWGGNGYGQSDVPTDLQNPRYLDVGRYESCVLDDSGVRCWGRLSYLSRDFEAGTIHQLSRERTTVALKSTGFAIWEDGTQSNDQLIPEVIWSEGFESPVLNATNFPLYNGDWVNFGTPTPNFDTGSDAPVDTSFTGDSGSVWTVSLGNIDIANSSLFDAAEGSQSLNLNGHEQGAVQVTIDFPANGTYELEFALSKNPENVDTAEVAISLDGESVLGSPLSFSESVTREEMNYKLVRVRLQVDQSGDHVLELKSLNTGSPNGYGPVVDDLKIRQVIIFNDFDADGIKDLDDLDDDNDGTPDSEDAAPLDASVKKDSDGDGFDDLIDDFPFDATEWLDSDKDGTGDNSDPFPVDPKERSDVDGDGRGDNTDTDDDGDGLSDAREAELGSDPLNADTDGDGLVDGLELKLGTALLYSDSDFDGITDGEEVEVGRDPLAADYLVGSGVDVCIQDDRAIHCGYRSTLVFEGLQALFPAKTIDMTHMNGRTCVLSRAGEIACWGNDGGAATYIGDGTYVALAAGERHTCGINSASEVECFGDNSFGQSSVPALKNPTQITAGLRFTCAIDQGAVTCWGAGDQQANTPPITQNPRQISSSTYHSCVLDDTGVQCWGANDYGQSNVPDLLNPKFVDAGRYETCALDDSGIVCWGRIVSKSRAYEKGEVYRFAAEDSIAALTSRGFVFTTDRNSVNDVLISDLVFRDFDGDGILDMQDLDDDNDGSPDKEDSAPLDPSIKADSDGDGFNDSEDAFPNDPSEWLDFDGDLIGDNADLDDDSDGLEDSKESLLGTNPFDSDTDADGVLDGADDFPLDQNWSVDLDGDGLNPMIDADDDGDGMLDIDEQACGSDPLDSGSLAADNDADGVPDCVDDDADGDGQADGDEFFCGSDPLDADSKASDFDRDRLPDCVDPDDDNDGVKDEFDYYPYDAAKSEFGGQRAIIVAGGGPYPGNFLWPATQRVADLSYAALKVQGLTDDDIVYLSEGDNPNIDGTPTKASVQNAIEKIEAEPLGEVSDLMIYLVDHGGEGVFKLTNTDLLTAEDLKTWLDSVQSSQEISAVVVYDACQSGSFVPLLATDGQLDRTVIASTGPKQSAVFGSQGKISFSYDFWTNILLGAPLSEAYNWASSSMFLRKKQVSLIDTNSNGIGNEGEDRKALSFKLFGEGNVLASDFPVVGEIQVLKELTGQTETQLRVDRVVGASAIVSVEAFVSGPDRYIQPPDEPIVDSVSFTLKVQDDGSWLGTLTGLEVIGDYEVSVIAENENGVLSHATEDSSNSVIINQKSGRAPILESDSDDDGLGDINDLDDDNDGVLDEADAYPLISLNGLTDSDNDGRPDDCDDACETLGMVADSDDDNDGVPDVDDAFPLDGTKSSEQGSNRFSFDVDESLKAEPLTDGLLVIRYLFGFSGDSLTSGAVSGGSNRDTPDAIASYLADADSQLDIDGDGESKPLTDGLLLIRYLFGFSGDSLVSGAIGTDATRNTAEEVEAYIKERVPAE